MLKGWSPSSLPGSVNTLSTRESGGPLLISSKNFWRLQFFPATIPTTVPLSELLTWPNNRMFCAICHPNFRPSTYFGHE